MFAGTASLRIHLTTTTFGRSRPDSITSASTCTGYKFNPNAGGYRIRTTTSHKQSNSSTTRTPTESASSSTPPTSAATTLPYPDGLGTKQAFGPPIATCPTATWHGPAQTTRPQT